MVTRKSGKTSKVSNYIMIRIQSRTYIICHYVGWKTKIWIFSKSIQLKLNLLKPSIRGFQNGLTSGSRDICFSTPRKSGVLWKELKGEIHTWKGTNNRIFDLFFSNHIQFSKIKACFVQNYTDFYMKYFSHCRQVVFGFWHSLPVSYDYGSEA